VADGVTPYLLNIEGATSDDEIYLFEDLVVGQRGGPVLGLGAEEMMKREVKTCP
jgi:hypothetical protein